MKTRHQQTPRCFDRQGDALILIIAVLSKQVEQQLIAERVVEEASPGQHESSMVNNGDVLVVFSPVDATEHGTMTHLTRALVESAVHAERSNGRARGPAPHWLFVTSATGEVSVSAGAQMLGSQIY